MACREREVRVPLLRPRSAQDRREPAAEHRFTVKPLKLLSTSDFTGVDAFKYLQRHQTPRDESLSWREEGASATGPTNEWRKHLEFASRVTTTCTGGQQRPQLLVDNPVPSVVSAPARASPRGPRASSKASEAKLRRVSTAGSGCDQEARMGSPIFLASRLARQPSTAERSGVPRPQARGKESRALSSPSVSGKPTRRVSPDAALNAAPDAAPNAADAGVSSDADAAAWLAQHGVHPQWLLRHTPAPWNQKVRVSALAKAAFAGHVGMVSVYTLFLFIRQKNVYILKRARPQLRVARSVLLCSAALGVCVALCVQVKWLFARGYGALAVNRTAPLRVAIQTGTHSQ